MTKKVMKKIDESDDGLTFILPVKLVPAQDGVSNTPAIKQESEEEVVTDTEEVAMESEEEEVLATEMADEEEVLTTESDKTEDTEEVAMESEEEEEVTVESEEEETEVAVEQAEPEKELKLSEELGDLKLEQEVKDKIDAAFDTIVKEKVAKIKEELEAGSKKELEESQAKLEESVRLYCEKAARTFVTENKLALRDSLRLQYFESFFGKVRKLFKENFVELPEKEEELAKELKTENEELKNKTDELLKDNVKLAEAYLKVTRQSKIDKVASDMFLTESERFKTASTKLLSEKLTEKRFEEKLKAISELFSKKPVVKPTKKLLSEGKLEKAAKTEVNVEMHPDVKAILGEF